MTVGMKIWPLFIAHQFLINTKSKSKFSEIFKLWDSIIHSIYWKYRIFFAQMIEYYHLYDILQNQIFPNGWGWVVDEFNLKKDSKLAF